MTFAQAAQVSRHLPWRLRKPRKSRGICRDVCASRASLAAFAVSVPPRVSPWAMVHRAYSPARYVHSPRRGGRCIRAAQGFAPRVSPPRGFAAQGFALGYGPPGLQPGRGTCIRVPSGTRQNSPASADAPGQLRRRPQTPPASFPASAEAVLIGISVRLHLAFASGFLSVCEGKGLYVRRACQYVILRISSRPCAWPECSFYRCPICCLSAPYASRGVPEIREP